MPEPSKTATPSSSNDFEADLAAVRGQTAPQDDFAADLAAVRGERPPDFRTTNEPPSPSLLAQAGEAAANFGLGAVRGAIGTVQTLAKPIRWAAGMAPATPPPAETTWAGTLGHAAEQIGEVILPGGKIAEAGELAATKIAPKLTPYVGSTLSRYLPKAAVEAAGQAGIATAQGGDPRLAAIGGAAVPAVGAAIEAVPDRLKQAALKQVVQALGPTKEKFKAVAEKLAPQILQRGLGGSREVLQAKAASTLEQVGDQLDTILTHHAQQPIATQPIIAALESTKDAFRTTNAAGVIVEFEPRAIKQLSGLQKILTDLGPTPTVEQVVAVRRAWDKVVSQAGGFEHRAQGAIGVPLKDISEAWAKREATTAIRQQLAADVPDLAAINKEYAFWKGLDDVLRQTLKRTQPQGPGIVRQGAEIGGAIVGGQVGSALGPGGTIGGAAVLGKLTKMAASTFNSPRWKLASARIKDDIANAIVSGDVNRVAAALTRVTAVEGSKLGQP